MRIFAAKPTSLSLSLSLFIIGRDCGIIAYLLNGGGRQKVKEDPVAEGGRSGRARARTAWGGSFALSIAERGGAGGRGRT